MICLESVLLVVETAVLTPMFAAESSVARDKSEHSLQVRQSGQSHFLLHLWLFETHHSGHCETGVVDFGPKHSGQPPQIVSQVHLRLQVSLLITQNVKHTATTALLEVFIGFVDVLKVVVLVVVPGLLVVTKAVEVAVFAGVPDLLMMYSVLMFESATEVVVAVEVDVVGAESAVVLATAEPVTPTFGPEHS